MHNPPLYRSKLLFLYLLPDSDSVAKTLFISAIGGITIFAVTTFYTDFLKQPRIDILPILAGYGVSYSYYIDPGGEIRQTSASKAKNLRSQFDNISKNVYITRKTF